MLPCVSLLAQVVSNRKEDEHTAKIWTTSVCWVGWNVRSTLHVPFFGHPISRSRTTHQHQIQLHPFPQGGWGRTRTPKINSLAGPGEISKYFLVLFGCKSKNGTVQKRVYSWNLILQMLRGQGFSQCFLPRSRDHPTKQWKVFKTQDACGKMFGAWCKTYNRELVPYVLYHIRGMIFGTQPDAKPSALVFRLPQCQQPLGLKLEPGRGLFVNAVLWAWKDHWPGVLTRVMLVSLFASVHVFLPWTQGCWWSAAHPKHPG